MGLTEAPRGAVGIAGARDHVGAERPRRVKFVLVLRTFLGGYYFQLYFASGDLKPLAQTTGGPIAVAQRWVGTEWCERCCMPRHACACSPTANRVAPPRLPHGQAEDQEDTPDTPTPHHKSQSTNRRSCRVSKIFRRQSGGLWKTSTIGAEGGRGRGATGGRQAHPIGTA